MSTEKPDAIASRGAGSERETFAPVAKTSPPTTICSSATTGCDNGKAPSNIAIESKKMRMKTSTSAGKDCIYASLD